ncbi:MAG: oxygen-independent coproporphyrinogen III oxidase [Hyphomonadaceae bacterium]
MAARVPAGAVVRHLHFGGGSPDSLEPVEIDAIFEALKSSFRFAPDAEIAAEMDPRGATAAVVDAFARGGLPTALASACETSTSTSSAGSTGYSPPRSSKRPSTCLRQAGVASLNLDIMYGLPGQNEAHAAKTAAFAASLGADRIAAFGYAHVPWFKKHQNAIKTADLAQGEERFRQAERVARTLIDAGYSPVGFDHFARPGDSLAVAARSGTLRRNFQGYTTDVADALIGLGPSAISSLPDLHYQNAPSTADYRTTVGDGALPVVRGAMLREEDRQIAGLIENLLCRFEAELQDALDGATVARLERLQAAGLATVGNGRVRITPMGRTYARNVAASFDPGFYATTAARHSVAV